MTPGGPDLCRLSISEASELLATRQLSPVELTRAFLERIDAVDRHVRAFVRVTADVALAQARAAEAELAAGRHRGPLHGIPVAFKDLYDTAGIPTTGQSRLFESRLPQRNATVVQRLLDAGAVLLGKLALYELGIGGPVPSLFERARNPWQLDHITGGSSSGSAAAVAADLCMAALGTETVGSIRVPAALCGVVGLKPTYGRVSRHGVLPLSWTSDHCGPFTRTTRDAALVLEAIAGYDPADRSSSREPVSCWAASLGEPLTGVRVGVLRRPLFEPDAQVGAAVAAAVGVLERLGARVVEVDLSLPPAAFFASPVIMLSEAFASHRAHLAEHRHLIGELARQRILAGGVFSASDYLHAQRVRRRVRREMSAAVAQVDVLVTPTTGAPASHIEETDAPAFSPFFSQVGLPSISVPCGFSGRGLPIGLQLMAKAFDELSVLRVADAYEREARWVDRRPVLPSA